MMAVFVARAVGVTPMFSVTSVAVAVALADSSMVVPLVTLRIVVLAGMPVPLIG